MSSGWRWDLPLFTKELLELAARRRTYAVRSLYVGLLCYFVLGTLAYTLRSPNALDALGQGLPILTSLVNWQFAGIYLFLPAMACGVFTTEKERNTLPLLFLTRLGPWTLIIEKLSSRLFPMLMFLLSSLPVMAFTYSMGGLTAFQIFCSAWFLLLAAFQLACIAVMCSTLNYSTATALIQTYFFLFLMSIMLPFVAAVFPQFIQYMWELILFPLQGRLTMSYRQAVYQIGLMPEMLQQTLSPRGLFQWYINPSLGVIPVGTRTSYLLWTSAILLGLPSLMSGIVCLYIARWALYRRAFVTPSNPLLKIFRSIDKIFFWAHSHVAFDVKLVREADTLPDDDPIGWREVSKRSLGQFRYLVRIMIPMLFPVIFIGMFMATSSANDWNNRGTGVTLSPLVIFLGSVNIILVGITAANAVPLERSRQTWEVLRSMPMTGREILIQKLRGVGRLQWVCAIPVICAICLEAWWRYQLLQSGLSSATPGSRFADDNFLWWEYIIGAIASLWVYLELAKWVSLWCGLVVKNSLRAILASGLAIVFYTGLPSLLLFLLLQLVMGQLPEFFDADAVTATNYVVGMTWPTLFTIMNEGGDLRVISKVALFPAFINLMWQGILLFALRQHVLNRAEWYLGRMGPATNWRSRALSAAENAVTPHGSAAPEIARAHS